MVILTVVLPIFVAVLGQALVQRLVPPGLRQEHNDVAGFIYAVLGVAYAVLLAFVAIVVWEDYETAESTVESEANELAGIYFLANRFSDSERAQVHDLARSYARVVVEEEWPVMEQGKTSSRASSLLSELRLSVQNLDTPTEADLVLYDQALTRFHDLANARRLRLVAATEGLPAILWVILIGGGVVTVCSTYLFGLKNNWAHALMIAALALVICAILLTIGLLEYPFAGEIKVQPDAFEVLIATARQYTRAIITEHLMTIGLPGGERLGSSDLSGEFPASLKKITIPDLHALLERADPQQPARNRCARLSLPDRLYLMVDMFRCYQERWDLPEPPFTPE